MTTLLPCPFCGAKTAMSILEDEPGETISAWVACRCGVEIRERRTEEEAALHWNTRATSLDDGLCEEELPSCAFESLPDIGPNESLADYIERHLPGSRLAPK